MGFIDGLQHELDGRLAPAVAAYRDFLGVGTAVDRIGICQMIAGCYERMGRRAEAARWRLRAARGWWRTPAKRMPRAESAYYALLEFKAAAEDAWLEARLLRGIVGEYSRALDFCIGPSASGYSHKILFAGVLWEHVRDFRRAMHYFFLAGDTFAAQAAEMRRPDVRRLARECYESARGAATMAGLMDEAQRARRAMRGR